MKPSGESSEVREIVLVGGGHSHAVALRRFGLAPLPGVRLSLVCSDVLTPYSGMLPGYVAGHYGFAEVHIDLARLAAFAGARLYRGEVVGIDRAARQVICRDGPPLPYDWLSLNIGSTPRADLAAGGLAQVLPVKPIRGFNQRWLALLDRVRAAAGEASRPITIAVVGAGAGGVELLLAMQWRLQNELRAGGGDPSRLHFHLLSGSAEILPTHAPSVRRKFMAILAARGVTVHRRAEVSAVGDGWLQVGRRDALAADEIVWVTTAGGAAWLAATGLALDDGGFIRVHDTLQTLSDARIFAAGDIASLLDYRLEKAGVLAVRQGKPLAENLRRVVRGQALRPYRPQRRWLALISTGDRYAVASRGAFAVAGAWVWRWKDWIDRSFMAQFAELPRRES